jgi:hypothetical protein
MFVLDGCLALLVQHLFAFWCMFLWIDYYTMILQIPISLGNLFEKAGFEANLLVEGLISIWHFMRFSRPDAHLAILPACCSLE